MLVPCRCSIGYDSPSILISFGGPTFSHPAIAGPERMNHYVIRSPKGDASLSTFSWEEVAPGLAAVSARENIRSGICVDMQKKETDATTGTRIVLWFFGDWDYTDEDIFKPGAVSIGYAKGAPMASVMGQSGAQ